MQIEIIKFIYYREDTGMPFSSWYGLRPNIVGATIFTAVCAACPPKPYKIIFNLNKKNFIINSIDQITRKFNFLQKKKLQ